MSFRISSYYHSNKPVYSYSSRFPAVTFNHPVMDEYMNTWGLGLTC